METQELTLFEKSLTKNIELLAAFKEQANLVGTTLKQIKVVDESTLTIAQQNLSKASNLATMIEDNRKKIKEPYFDAGKKIDTTVKDLSAELLSGITHAKNEIAEWNKKKLAEEAAKQAEIARKLKEEQEAIQKEQERKQAIRDYISQKAQPLLEGMYAKCTSADICQEKLDAIEKGYKPRMFFEEFADEAYELKDRYVNLIKAKKEQFEKADTLSDDEKKMAESREKLELEKAALAKREAEIKAKEEAAAAQKAKEDAEKLAEEERQKAIAEAAMNKTKGVRYNWDFELVDISKVNKPWLTLNDSAIKDWIKENKEKLFDGQMVDGVKFFKKPIVVS